MANIQKKQQINKNIQKILKKGSKHSRHTYMYAKYLHISSFFSTETFIYFKNIL